MHLVLFSGLKNGSFVRGRLFGNTFLDIKLIEKQIRAGNFGTIVEPFFTTVIQNPGDFLVLKPLTYHFGFNIGFNINEGKIQLK
jgi:hypothetical protein